MTQTMIQRERLIQTFLDLVQLGSESKQERPVADYTMEKLRALGYEVREDNAGESIGGNAGNVIAYKPGNAEGKSLLFCAHMDTVPPGNHVKPIVDGDIIRTDGTTVLGGDDKAGIAAILEAVMVIEEKQIAHGPIQVIFTIAEEIGLLGAKYVDLDGILKVDAAFFFDSDGKPNEICVASPYHIDVTVTFKGKAVHAGLEPENGISAIQMAAKAIAAMKLGRLDADSTANIGIIESGRATNVVPGKAVIYGEARSLKKERVDGIIADMVRCCQEAADEMGGTIDVEIEESYASIELTEDSPTVQLACAAAKRIGLEPKLVKSGGGSDANVFCGKGVAATNVGVGMTKVHSVEEYLEIDSMHAASDFILAVIEESRA